MTNSGIQIYLNALLSEISMSPDLPAANFEETELLRRAEHLAASGANSRHFGAPCGSIFEFLATGKQGGQSWHLPPKSLVIDNTLFPITEKGDASPKSVNSFLKDFQSDFENLPADNLAKAETLLFLLQKYATGLPSGYSEQISLFDFAKVKAALAVCLEETQEEKFMLIGGSVSGVQTFLYDIVSKNAAKNLKGRSFYLHLLADSAVFSLLKKLGLPRANVVYSSGGSFFILAPNTEKTTADFLNWKKETLKWFFDTHNLRLFLETGFEIFEAKQLLENGLPTIFNQLQLKLRDAKKHPFAEQLIGSFGELFEPHGDGGDAERDVITGEELKKGDQVPFEIDAKSKPVTYISAQTESIKCLGNALRKTNYWVTSNEPLGISKLVEIEQAGVWQTLFENLPKGKLPTGSLIRQFNEFKFEGSNIAFGFEFYGGNDQPMVKRPDGFFTPKSFSELANVPDEKESYFAGHEIKKLEFSRLAVLRMDVDGLGNILQEGLPTLAHYATLSRSLDWFFKGHLNHIWESGEVNIPDDNITVTPDSRKFKNWTQILYAGGDDLFLVGRWDCLLDFSFKIQQAFHQYVCENEKLGLSGGIALVTHKYPIMKAAKQAGEAESIAKQHKKSGFFKKNSFTFLGCPLHWKTEFEVVKSLKIRLVEARRMEQKPMPQSILMKIAAFYEQRDLQRKLGEPPSWK